jgi:hypothetical protein
MSNILPWPSLALDDTASHPQREKRGQNENDNLLRKQVRFSWTPEDSVQLIAVANKETRVLSVLSSYYTFEFKVFLCVSSPISVYLYYT